MVITRKTVLRAAVLALLVFGVATRTQAATIDLNSLSIGQQGTTTLVFPEATLISGGADFYVGASGIDHEICALTGGFDCEADLTVNFSTAVSNLSFQTFGWDPGDLVTAYIYGSGNVLLGTALIASNTTVSFGATAGIVQLFLDDTSTGAGIAYDNFLFDQAAVPEPTTLLLTGLGLAYGAARRRLAIQKNRA